MKGNAKFLNRLIVWVMSILISASVLCVGMMLNKTRCVNAAVSSGEKYSQKDEGDIVLSVEKVGILSTGDDYLKDSAGNDLTNSDEILSYYNSSDYCFKNANIYANNEKTIALNKLYVDNTRDIAYPKPDEDADKYPSYYYKDIQNGTNEKTVYHSGDYIMLENNLKTKNGYTYYYNPAIKAYNYQGEVDMAEGVLFSFGSYILGTNSDDYTSLIRNSESEKIGYTYAKNIQQINVSATLNGSLITLPVVRQYGEGNYQDFTFIIPQRKGFDGHYEFEVEYRHDEVFKRQTFSFDLVFKSTYTEPEFFTGGSGYSYDTMPKINVPVGSANEYYLGSNVQYPTLTYDFSKFTLDYTLSANGLTTSYSYRRVLNSNNGYDLVGTISSSNGTYTTTEHLNGENKAVFVFTEVGHYQFEYEYIYNGEQNDMGFTLDGDSLDIYGFELKYSKAGYSEAQMRYLKIRKHTKDMVVLIVPNGYLRENEPEDLSMLGVAYSIDEIVEGVGQDYRTGYIYEYNDALIQYSTKKPTFQQPTNLENETYIDLTQITYNTTNQGGIWFSSNRNYVENNSYYYFSATKITSETARKTFDNTTSFNQVGYYLVVINVNMNVENQNFYEVFAFRYTNSTSNVEVNALTVNANGEPVDQNNNATTDRSKYQYTTPIGSGKFTNRAVKISWENPGVFERKITVKYYSNLNVYLTRDESKSNGTNILTSNELLKQAVAKEVKNGDILGENIAAGNGSSFLIEATNEGQAKAYRSFTIDKTNIAGVSVYQVAQTVSNGNTIYTIKVDAYGDYVSLNSITNGNAAIYWRDKVSGAAISATYYYAPFVKGNDVIASVYNTSDQIWFTNQYVLGKQTGPFKVEKPEQLNSSIASSNVLKNDGVYLFVLTDDAGNSCKYMFIIDDTEQYFKIDKFYTQENLVYSDATTVEFATHKAIKISPETSEINNEINTLISAFVGNSSDLGNYYTGELDNNSNISKLQELFNSNTSGEKYLTVKNTKVELLNQYNESFDPIKVEKISPTENPKYIINPENKFGLDEKANEYVRRLYIFGENQANITQKDGSNSYIRVEINNDHSLGKVYYTNDQNSLSDEDDLRSKGYMLSTGTDISAAMATCDDLVAFYWTQGVGEYEIEKITYLYYPITEGYNNSIYFYNGTPAEVELYVKGNTAQPVKDQSDRYYKEINVQSGKTQEGLYIVNRYYVGNNNSQSYYFIVDRSEINENKQISLKLLEENDYNNFTKYGTKAENFSDPDDLTNVIHYQVSLKTNKVPVQIKVPVGKFFDGVNKSSYYAGRLNLTLYYIDKQNQIDGGVHRVFSTKDYVDGLSDKEAYYTNSDYLFINLKEAIKSDYTLYPMVENISGSDWIWLAGDYVFVVEDNVLSSSLTNRKKTFAFSVEKQNPSTNLFATVEETDSYENSAARAEYNETENRFNLSTNAEFVKLELKQYDKSQFSAQIDPNYLVVTRNMDGVNETYFNFQHRNLGGLKNLADFSFDENTLMRTIVLETGLKRKNGAIDMVSSAKHVEYTIKIRFKLTKELTSTTYEPIYANCYRIKEDGKWASYYEMTYFAVIDRMPPTANISALEQRDTLADKYNQENGIDSMFEVAAYENGGQYFVNRYASYYNNKKAGNIYAFEVANTTPFSTQDVNRLYYRQIASLENISLNLPISNFATYTMISSVDLTSKTTYGGVFPSNIDVNKYYEVVEVDAAGNMSQYVILYRGETSLDDVNSVEFTFNATYVDDAEIKNGKVTMSNTNKEITLFTLTALTTDDNDTLLTDRFFNIEILKNGAVVKVINTNFETKFTNTGLSTTICEVVNTNGLGNYTINVNSRHNTATYIIRYYDQNTRIELDASDLVKRDSTGNFRIELGAANINQNGILYYATEIEVTGLIEGENKTNTYNFVGGKYYLNGEEISSITGLTGTYQIKLTDAFGATSTYRFDTVQGDMFHSIAFAGATSGNPKYYKSANIYYGFTNATIKFNSSLYKQITLSYSINGVQHQYTVSVVDGGISISPSELVSGSTIQYEYLLGSRVDIIKIDGSNDTIELLPFTATSTGAIVDYSVALWYGNSVEYTYNVVLDSYTKKVSLKSTENLEHVMDYEYNQDYEKVIYRSTTSGVMNLMWDKVENDYFTYTYKLYEKMADDTIATYDLDDFTSRVINTTSDSKGVYWFEITIYTKDGYRLGNKVYAFSVVATLTDLYYVQTKDMVAISANSSFKLSELPTDFNYSSLKLDNETEITKPIINLPLYISNKALTVVLAEDQGAQIKYTNTVRLLNDKAEFVLYRVYTNTYSRYFATLVVKPDTNDQIAKEVTIKNGTSESFVQDYINTYYVEDKLTLNFTQTSASLDNISKKNYIILNIYHNNLLLEKVSYSDTLSIEYEIKGSGEYRFEICDLAGNKHVFKFNDQIGTDITINVMKNIYFTMNGNAPIANAVFNDAVELNVVNPYNYDAINTQPVSIRATRNGNVYTPKQKGYSYTFEDFGSYEVTFSATYDEKNITSTISFVIMNKNEARLSYDLTSVMKYNIVKVENQSGEDITEAFKKVITQNGKLLSYDVLMENSDDLGLSAGKQSLKVTYEIVDGTYPARQATFVFTLNDEVPTIECSLELGKETNKGFDITFNPGIIYEQVGDSYIYINDTLVYEINETSVLEMVKHSITQKENGSGDYYVKLIGSSGNVITSFKVVVKEPLNIWAIIIIVVVSVIVIGVTLTIVILRNKMRIR